jgi:YHS domain-containing protein
VAGSGLGWNVTTVANVVALVVAGVLYALYRNRGRLGGGRGSAVDPVCGMVVRPADAPARVIHGGRPVHFCSDRCAERFAADPARYAGRGSAEPAPAAAEPAPAAPEPVAFVRRSGPGPEPGRRPSIRSTPVADPTRRR